MQMKVASALYAIKPRKLGISADGVNLGLAVPDPGAKSRHRPMAAMAANAKISMVAAALETLLTEPGWAFAAGPDGTLLYAEHQGQSLMCNGDSVRHTGDRLHTEQAVMMLFVQVLTSGTDQELAETFRRCVDEYTAEGAVSTEPIALLCDSFYYGTAKRIPEIRTQEATQEEIDAALRSIPVVKAEALKGTEAYRYTPAHVKVASKKARKKPAAHTGLADLVARCYAGEYRVPYAWPEEAAPYIQGPDGLDGFVPNETFRAVLEKIRLRTSRVLERMEGLDLSNGQDRVKALGGDYINVTLSGKPGTGKTRLAYALSSATGMPVYTVSCSHNTDEDEFTGMTKMVDGKPAAVPTDTVRCFEGGGILLLEEINLPQAAVVMGALGQAVEFPFILKKDGYIPVRRHPLCIIISTMNTGTAGSKVLSQPFANRFKQSFVLDDPSKADFIRILGNTGADQEVCAWVYECYSRIVACVEDENAVADTESILLSLSMRSCIGAIENIQEGMAPLEAVKNSIIGKVSEQDRTVAESCMKVMKSMRELDL